MPDNKTEELTQENAYLRSLLDSFFSGNVPKGASLEHCVLARWGRRRLEELSKKPALLQKEDE